MSRIDGRKPNELRKINIIPDFTKQAMGSVLIECGSTRVICTASFEDSVPPFLKGSGKGWVTAEYSMLPGATRERNRRDISSLKLNGRASEIQRLIGRSLRSVVDLYALGESSIIIDCDVIEADGGTRTASITGGFIALCLAVNKLLKGKIISKNPIKSPIAAVSCGIVNGEPLLDLCYDEDSNAEADMNFVMTSTGIAEIQGTGEKRPFTQEEFQKLYDFAKSGITELINIQMQYCDIIKKEKLVVATKNKGKLEEIKDMLKDLPFEVVSQADVGILDDIEENGKSFEENALIKARYIAKKTKCMTIADDSGLCVDSLSGAPGIMSARYCEGSDDDRINKLLDNLKDKPVTSRSAHFVSAIAFVGKGTEFTVTGECYGIIAEQKTGNLGFGYDGVFYDVVRKATFGELPAEIKNSISHRANAMEKFKKEVIKYL